MAALAVGYEGADPLIEWAVRDPDGEGKRETEKRQRRVDVLQQLYHKELETPGTGILEYQLKAGRDFQEDASRAELRSQSSPSMIAMGSICYFGLSDGKLSALESASKARGRLRRALGRLGSQAELFAVRVLLERWSPAEAVMAQGKRRDVAIETLRTILDVLDRFYVEHTRAS